MNLVEYLNLYCIAGGAVGGLIRSCFPQLFFLSAKRKQYAKLRPLVAIILGAIIGFGAAIFFEADLVNSGDVHKSHLKKLGLFTAIFVMSAIDRLDKLSPDGVMGKLK